jgi:hypothetical protein
VIDAAEEFVRLRTSEDSAEYNPAAARDAADETWLDLIERFPEMRFWVAQNKTLPLSVLEILRHTATCGPRPRTGRARPPAGSCGKPWPCRCRRRTQGEVLSRPHGRVRD